MVELFRGLSADAVRSNLERVREEIAGTGRDPAEVEILAAVKYVPVEELEALAEAGVTLVGENRAQELVVKTDASPEGLTWDFIGHLQSRKVRDVLPLVRYIHSVASDSVLAQLARHGTRRHRGAGRGQRGRRRGQERYRSGAAAGLPGALPGGAWSG